MFQGRQFEGLSAPQPGTLKEFYSKDYRKNNPGFVRNFINQTNNRGFYEILSEGPSGRFFWGFLRSIDRSTTGVTIVNI